MQNNSCVNSATVPPANCHTSYSSGGQMLCSWCNAGYIKNSAGTTCTACATAVSHCITCNTSGSNMCELCSPGYVYYMGTCQACATADANC